MYERHMATKNTNHLSHSHGLTRKVALALEKLTEYLHAAEKYQ